MVATVGVPTAMHAEAIAVDPGGTVHMACSGSGALFHLALGTSGWEIDTLVAGGHPFGWPYPGNEIVFGPDGAGRVGCRTEVRQLVPPTSGGRWASSRVDTTASFGTCTPGLTADGRPLFWSDAKSALRERFAPGLRLLVAPTQAATGPATADPVAGLDWSAALVAAESGVEGSSVEVGVGSGTSLFSPPGLPAGALRLVVERDVNGALVERATDVLAAGDTHGWPLVLTGEQAPGEVALHVTTRDLPAGTALSILDTESGRTWAVRAGEPVTLAARGAGHRLRLIATTAGVTQEPGSANRVLGAYPLPFRRDVGVRLDLGRSTPARLEVYDVGGRLVQSRSLDTLAPGEHVLLWDGRARGGRDAPSGVYLVRVSLGRESHSLRVVKVE